MAAVPELPGPIPPALRDAVLDWYDATGRALPFRGTRDPYAILVSEVMAQQTQVARAAEAWVGWMNRFPTVEALATAPLADVLRAWAGLGYNRRAVHLHRAARVIVARAGRVPDAVEELLRLPGIGPYTARAVAAIAFGRRVGAVDTNVRRVLGRITAGADDILSLAVLQAIADAAVPADRPGDWTHALMDLGARLCVPRRPRCGACPAAPWCRVAAAAAAANRPEAARPAPASPSAGTAAPTRRVPTRAVGRRGDRPGAVIRAERRAAAADRPTRLDRRQPAFRSTARWLRGRIVARLRDAPDGAWLTFDGPIGPHEWPAVRAALEALARDGLVELDGSDRARIATIAAG